METLQQRRLQSLARAHDFITRRAERLGGIGESGAYLRLGEILTLIGERAWSQMERTDASRMATVSTRGLRQAMLREHLRPIVRIARHAEREYPTLAKVRLPKGRPSNVRFVRAVHSMAFLVGSTPAPFVGAGLPADFAQRLHDAANALTEAESLKGQVGALRKGDTSSIRSLLAEGNKVLGVLDAMVRHSLHGETILLAEWSAATRVGVRALGAGAAVRQLPPATREMRALPAGDGTEPPRLETPGAGRHPLKRLLGSWRTEER